MKNNPHSTTLFTWQGLDFQGQPQQGQITAHDKQSAHQQLQQQGIVVKQLKNTYSLWQCLNKKPLSQRDITAFTRQLATLIKANVAILQALIIIENTCQHLTLRKLVQNIKITVEMGHSLHHALKQHPHHFSAMYCHLIEVGESSGMLEILLERVAQHQENMSSLAQQIKRALFYPLLVAFVAISVSAIMLIFIVPKFEELFANANSELPTLTRYIIKASDILQQDGWLILLTLFIIGIIVFISSKLSTRIANIIDYCKLYTPLFGKLIRQAIVARFCRTLATSLQAGMPLMATLQLVAKTANNRIYERQLLILCDDIHSGKTLHSALQKIKLFPDLAIQMIAIGEQTGELTTMLNKVADMFTEQLNQTIAQLNQLIEPVLMVIIGLLVGGLVVAMYLPIFELGHVF